VRPMTQWWLTASLLGSVLISGCSNEWYVAAESPFSQDPLQKGYGYVVSKSPLPDTPHYKYLVYASDAYTPPSRRSVVWPKLLSGYYGNDFAEDDLILFQILWPEVPGHPEGVPAVLAAKSGPPAVDVTKAIIRIATKGTSTNNAINLRYISFEWTNEEVCVHFDLGDGPDSQAAHVFFGRRELEDLITRLRSKGKQKTFNGTKYYAEE
jgi:hypothetical protein